MKNAQIFTSVIYPQQLEHCSPDFYWKITLPRSRKITTCIFAITHVSSINRRMVCNLRCVVVGGKGALLNLCFKLKSARAL